VLVCAAAGGAQTIRNDTVVSSDSQLVAEFDFRQTYGRQVLDATSPTFIGTIQGDAMVVPDATFGMALSVNGPTGKFTAPHDPKLEPATGAISVWIKADTLRDSDVVTKITDLLLDKNIPGGKEVYGIRLRENGRVAAIINSDEGYKLWVEADSPPNLFTAGVWHHVAMRWDGSCVAIFVDGRMRAASPYTPIADVGLSYHGQFDLTVGTPLSWPGSTQFVGQVADLKIYAGAVSDDQLKSDYFKMR
jgi:hypothetical protein